MGTDDERNRGLFAPSDRGLVYGAKIGRRVEVDARLAPSSQHQPADPDIGKAGGWVVDEIDRGRNIGSAVEPVLKRHRQTGEIGRLALEHDLVYRSVGGFDLDDRLRRLEPFQKLLQHRAFVDAECSREATSGPHDVAHHLRLLGPGGTKQDRLFIVIEMGRELGQRDRLVMDVDFSGRDQGLDGAAQPELL